MKYGSSFWSPDSTIRFGIVPMIGLGSMQYFHCSVPIRVSIGSFKIKHKLAANSINTNGEKVVTEIAQQQMQKSQSKNTNKSYRHLVLCIQQERCHT